MHAKFYALAIAALAHCAHARVSFDEIIEMQSTEIRNSNAFINPRGPLCLLRGLVYSELAYMHNKRFFSPEIETDYKLEPVGDAETTNEQTYTRNAQKDKPYLSAEGPALSSKPAGKNYSVEYHRTLIEMFPSTDGHTLSVAVDRDDSFFQFLHGMPTKQHAHYVLAALLLLSEGVDVPIKATQKTITLGTSILGNLPPEHRKTVGKESSTVFKTKKDLCKKAAQVINFFKENMQKEKLPCTQNDFSTGEFLNTPQFLIQAYVFEYITSKEDALDFAACVHAILTSLPEDSCKDAYNACFVESKAEAEEDEFLHTFTQIQKAMKNLESFPFPSPSMLPAYTSVHACKRGQTEFLDETFSNCVETGLFALFCCLAHHPVQKKYKADTMLGKKKEGEEAEALRAFFQLESVTPKACATKDTIQEWNRVVSGLQSEHIAYVRPSRNEVRSGIFNALYVVAEVTGRREKEEPRIRKLAQMLEESEIGKTSGDVFEKTQEYVEKLFTSLSVDKSLRVEFSDLKVGARSDGQNDLYGKITLKYTGKDSAIEQGLCLAFKPRHLIVTLCPCVFLSLTDEKKEAFFAVDGYSDPADFVECLLAGYAGAWRARGTNLQENKLAQDIQKATTSLLSPGASAHPNQLFLLESALRSKQIKEISKAFILCAAAKGIQLAQEHTGVRLLSNLLGSLPLDDYETQIDVLEGPVWLGMQRELFPRIAVSKKATAIMYKYAFAIIEIGIYAGDNCTPAANAIMKYFREYKDKAGEPLFMCYALPMFFAISDLFPLLLADKSTRHIDEIGTLLLDVEEEDRKDALDTKALFDFLVFLASLKHKETPPKLVLALCSRLGPRSIQMGTHADYRPKISSQEASAILEALGTHQSALLQTPSGEEVLDGVMDILQSTINRRA
ncbi:uncharacterized protein NEMAJ01_2339 [Nematocida major]|uniref:uncharacterized protein n=1 Tax=Nematocida major TaxID=1912982 RepID=UPI0020079F97|nr:uncharacterized protein NEMAJ01_2339 [Nematocida major]KAH9387443.1 hypothetical protein NEMAJ01_2339 [Nematocida major]